ncbi:DsrE family protein [Shewanella benthica]|nr:DsrE family protein [Shewanella benthica]
MQDKIDVRGMAIEEAIKIIDSAVAASESQRVEILTSDGTRVSEVVDHLSTLGATLEEVMCQSDEQSIIVNFPLERKLKIYVVGRDTLGHGDREIGAKLMTAYFNVSAEYPISASKIFFLNTGINLPLKGSDSVEAIKQLAHMGTEIIVCGTCLDFFGKREQLGVGRIGSMHDLIALHHGESDVITL